MEGKILYFWYCNYRYKCELVKKVYIILVNVKFYLLNEIVYGYLMFELVFYNSILRKRNLFLEFIVCFEFFFEMKKFLF